MFLKYKPLHQPPHILKFSGYRLGSTSHNKHRTKKTLNKRGIIALLGYGWGMGLSIAMFITFLYAYFGNNYRFAININSFGEAHIELVALTIVIPIVCYGFYLHYKEMKKHASAKT